MRLKRCVAVLLVAALVSGLPGPAFYEAAAQTVPVEVGPSDLSASPLAVQGSAVLTDAQALASPLPGGIPLAASIGLLPLTSPALGRSRFLAGGLGRASSPEGLVGPAMAASRPRRLAALAPHAKALAAVRSAAALAPASSASPEQISLGGRRIFDWSGLRANEPDGPEEGELAPLPEERVPAAPTAVSPGSPLAAGRPGRARGRTAAASIAAVRAAGLAASVWRRTPLRVRSFLQTMSEMALGDRELAHITQARDKQMAQTRALLVLDGLLVIAITMCLGPLLDTARLAGLHGLAAHWTALAAYSGVILAAFAAYVFVERKHVLMARILGLFAARDYRVALFKSLQDQEMDFHLEKEHSSGALAKRVLGDTNYLSNNNVSNRLSVVAYGVYLLFGVAMMFWIHALLALAVLAVIPFIGILNGRYGDKLIQLHFRQSDSQAEVMRQGQEALSQVQTVKSFAVVEKEVARFAGRAEELNGIGEQVARVTANYTMFANVLMSLFTNYMIYIAGGFLAALHGLSLGQVVEMSVFAGFAGSGFTGLSQSYLSFKRNQGSSRIARELLIRRPVGLDSPDAVPVSDVAGDVRFEGVSFAYPGRKSDGRVLDDVSFEVQPGQSIAFVGETGAGKSTIVKLLLRLWDPSAGRVLIDGRDIRSLKREEFLRRIAVVPQDTKLFNNTIRYNMLYGAGEVSEERLREAIRMAKADFVYDPGQFPKGLDTPVAEAGDRLSGGEQQRIAIVRALLRDPSILVLDEATSALDNESERVVQDALDNLSGGARGRKPTTLIVAHRLTTIQRADRIVVLDKGRIVESGTHAELLAAGGRYAELWKKGRYDAPLAEVPAASASAEPAVSDAPGASAPEAEAPPAAPRGWAASLAGALWGFVAGDGVLKPLLRRYRGWIIAAALLLIVDAGFWIASSHFLGNYLDAAEAAARDGLAGHKAGMIRTAGMMVGMLAGLTALDWLTAWLNNVLQVRVLRDLRVELMRTFLRREMAFHKEHSSGELASRLMEDADSLSQKNVSVRLPLLKNLLTLVAATGLLLQANLAMGLAVLGVMPVLGIINGIYGQRAEAMYVDFGRKRAEYGRTSQEALEHIQTVKMMGTERVEVERNGERASAVAEAGVPGAVVQANAHAFSSSITDFFTRYALYIGGAWVAALALGMTVGHIVAMTLFAGFIKSSFGGLSEAWMQYKQQHGETEAIRGWLAAPSRIQDAPGARPLPPVKGAISFEDVRFRYSDNGPASGGIEGLTLRVNPGQTVAFVGRTGAGKSTVLKLLQRLWDPQGGRISIDGHDIQGVTLASLNAQIAVVPQRPSLFNDTIRYNMLYGSEGASEADLLSAIQAARADFVFDKKAFPEGLDTQVGEGGAQLSGGQAQRVAIVRAILKKPRILLLDEATSKLDKQTEREIQETLERLSEGELGTGAKPTTLVVAHNLTTIMGADRIVVLDHGRIVDQGTHRELLSREGLYRSLWRAAQTAAPRY